MRFTDTRTRAEWQDKRKIETQLREEEAAATSKFKLREET